MEENKETKPIEAKDLMLNYLKENLEPAGYQISEFMQYLGGKKRISSLYHIVNGDKIEEWTLDELQVVKLIAL